MRPTILLFDIDGTLVTTGGGGRRGVVRVFAECFGRQDACSFRLDGMTDRAIARGGLIAIGAPTTEANIDAVLAAYVRVLEDEVASADSNLYRIHSGIVEALDAASATKAVAVGLGTGNIREGARVKLSKVGIYQRFPFGGFGCDHEDRTELLRCGAAPGGERLGSPREQCPGVGVRDPPQGIAAGARGRAQSVAVGDGRFSAPGLHACA